MSKDGSLSNLFIQMREQKAVDKILEQAKVEEVELKQGEGTEDRVDRLPAEIRESRTA